MPAFVYTTTNLASWLRQGEQLDGMDTAFPGWKEQLKALATYTDANEVEDALGRILVLWYDDLDSAPVLFMVNCMENRLKTLRPKEVGVTETVRRYSAYARIRKTVTPVKKRPAPVPVSGKKRLCTTLRDQKRPALSLLADEIESRPRCGR